MAAQSQKTQKTGIESILWSELKRGSSVKCHRKRLRDKKLIVRDEKHSINLSCRRKLDRRLVCSRYRVLYKENI